LVNHLLARSQFALAAGRAPVHLRPDARPTPHAPVMPTLASLLGLLMPACGATGARGVPVAPFDIARLVRPASPNSALAAPAGFSPPPDLVTPTYPVPPERLFAVLHGVADGQPRTFLAAEDAARLQAQFVARSRVLNFPDILSAQVLPAPAGDSLLVLYSRSMYGYSDFGANRVRLRAWLAAINAAVKLSR
jgi:uncharacterized protein (DUF1499 family)